MPGRCPSGTALCEHRTGTAMPDGSCSHRALAGAVQQGGSVAPLGWRRAPGAAACSGPGQGQFWAEEPQVVPWVRGRWVQAGGLQVRVAWLCSGRTCLRYGLCPAPGHHRGAVQPPETTAPSRRSGTVLPAEGTGKSFTFKPWAEVFGGAKPCWWKARADDSPPRASGQGTLRLHAQGPCPRGLPHRHHKVSWGSPVRGLSLSAERWAVGQSSKVWAEQRLLCSPKAGPGRRRPG